MNRFYRLLFFLCATYCTCIDAGNRQILFFVDWHNETVERDLASNILTGAQGFGPITVGMLTNLWQKAAPMIVSSATWRNYLERKQMFLDFITLSQPELESRYKGKSTRFSTTEAIVLFQKICKSLGGLEDVDPVINNLLPEYSGFLVCHFAEFNEKEWIISKISEHVYLFIPKIYQRQVDDALEMPARNASVAPGIRDADLRMGLKYTNKPLANIMQITTHDTSHYVNFSQEFVNALKNIFVTENDISNPNPAVDQKTNEDNKRNYRHIFDAYGIGHGGHGGVIMALPTPQFRAFLQFLNDQIRTRFMFYNTCYAGGIHLQAPYQEGEFNFTITTGTFLYAVTTLSYSWYPSVEFHINFSEYFRYLHDYFADREGVGLESVIQQVYQIGKIGKEGGWQLPAVRLPGWQKFKVIDLKRMDKISQKEVQDYAKRKKAITIKNKEVVILDVDSFEALPELEVAHLEVIIPVSIQDKMPSIFSMSTDTALVDFQSITTNQGFIALVKGFIPMRKQSFARTYFIPKITCRNDVKHDQAALIGATETQLIIEDVVIFNNAPNPLEPRLDRPLNGILFKYKNVFYLSTWKDSNDGLWQTFDRGSLPAITRVDVAHVPTYANLYEVYIKTYPATHWSTVREIINIAIGKQPTTIDTKGLLQALQRLNRSLKMLQGML